LATINLTNTGKADHYNVKFPKGYEFSITVIDSKFVLKNYFSSFQEFEVEEFCLNNIPYEKIVKSGNGTSQMKRSAFFPNITEF
jgi:hypothetical protein